MAYLVFCLAYMVFLFGVLVVCLVHLVFWMAYLVFLVGVLGVGFGILNVFGIGMVYLLHLVFGIVYLVFQNSCGFLFINSEST